ncbi:MAG TPA: hypothetical protein VL360_02400 [Gammaproteobacteria bacterium]|jgi:hypothetical protein|nr:hypothetical protein [Gammaproteobacteria bacterium]
MIITIPDIIGMSGVTLVLSAYGLLNLNKMSSDSYVYQLMNLIGSILLLISLCFNFNLSSVMIEVVWITFSVIGIIRVFRSRQLRAEYKDTNIVEFSAAASK